MSLEHTTYRILTYRTLSIIYSHNVELSHILVNNTGNFVDSCQ